VVSALGRFGRNVGAALHIAENLSELTSVHPQTQRDVLLRPTPSLAVVSAIGHDPHLSLALKTLRDTEDIALAQEIAERVDAFGGLDVANEAVLHYSWQARRALAAVPQNGYRNSLDQLALNLAISA
jgi:geranylgeranyl pyrophosphate synthase